MVVDDTGCDARVVEGAHGGCGLVDVLIKIPRRPTSMIMMTVMFEQQQNHEENNLQQLDECNYARTANAPGPPFYECC
jgi:hypothetical protein